MFTAGYEVFAETQARREREFNEVMLAVLAAPPPTPEERMEQLRKALFEPEPTLCHLVLSSAQAAFFAAIAEQEELDAWLANQGYNQ